MKICKKNEKHFLRSIRSHSMTTNSSRNDSISRLRKLTFPRKLTRSHKGRKSSDYRPAVCRIMTWRLRVARREWKTAELWAWKSPTFFLPRLSAKKSKAGERVRARRWERGVTAGGGGGRKRGKKGAERETRETKEPRESRRHENRRSPLRERKRARTHVHTYIHRVQWRIGALRMAHAPARCVCNGCS